MVGKVDSVLHQEDFTLQEVGRGFLLQCVLIGSDSDRTQFHSVDELKPLIVQHELLDSKKRIQESRIFNPSSFNQVLELLGVSLAWLQKNVLTPNTQHLTTFRLHQVGSDPSPS